MVTVPRWGLRSGRCWWRWLSAGDARWRYDDSLKAAVGQCRWPWLREESMRVYLRNSPQALARLVAMVVVADGRLHDLELKWLDQRGIYDALGINAAGFGEVLLDLCRDVVLEAEQQRLYLSTQHDSSGLPRTSMTRNFNAWCCRRCWWWQRRTVASAPASRSCCVSCSNTGISRWMSLGAPEHLRFDRTHPLGTRHIDEGEATAARQDTLASAQRGRCDPHARNAPRDGLSDEEAARRFVTYGPNELPRLPAGARCCASCCRCTSR